jgi:processive 1,2-diacylglycerol beta-glucosyltransferase
LKKTRLNKSKTPARLGQPRILVLSASVGAGHLRAAEAVAAGCRRLAPKARVRHVDVLTLTSAVFRRLYGKGCIDLVNRAPEIMGLLYDRTNRQTRNAMPDAIRLLVERLNTKPLVRFVREFAPDVVCHTHFLPAEIMRHERRRGRFDAAEAVVVTDFDVHRYWHVAGVRLYCVAREECRDHLVALGVSPESIRVTGIPIDPVFNARPRLADLRLKHGVDARKPLILVLGGGFGIGPIEILLERLIENVRGAEIVVVAGRNQSLRKKLVQSARRAPVETRVIGFTREMHEWMALATLVVTKPGGLTTSEALACGVPVIVANAIPGQETRNATMLYERGAALSGENALTIGARAARLLRDPERLKAMRRAARSLARPRAAMEVARELLRMTDSRD